MPHRYVPAVAVFCFAGCAIGAAWPHYLGLYLLAWAALAVTSLRLPGTALLTAVLPLSAAWSATCLLRQPADTLDGLNGRTVLLRGVVAEPEAASQYSARMLVDVQWLAYQKEGAWTESTRDARVMVTIPAPTRSSNNRSPFPAPAHWGQTVAVTGILQAPSSTPTFDYAAWLAAKGVFHVLKARAADVGVLHAPPPLVARIRRRMQAALDDVLPYPYSAVLRGVVLAEGGGLPEDVVEGFRATGTYHVMVTAGIHVNLLTAAWAALCGRLGVNGVASSLLGIPLVAAYAAIVGGTPSITRAAIMCCLSLLAAALGRRSLSLVSLSVAVIGMLAWNPLLVRNPGFQMSIGCVLGIDLLSPLCQRLLGWLPQAWRHAATVTLATQLAIGPLAAAYFHILSPMALLANLVVVPLCEVVLAGGLWLASLGALLGTSCWLWRAQAPLLGVPLYAMIGIALRLVRWLSAAPGCEIAVATPAPAALVLYYCILALFACIARVKEPRKSRRSANETLQGW